MKQKWILATDELANHQRGEVIVKNEKGQYISEDDIYKIPFPDGIFEAMPHWLKPVEMSECRALVPVGPLQYRPKSYGHRTLVEKVTAYRLSDGELVQGKEMALKYQAELDDEVRLESLMNQFLTPFQAIPVEGDNFELKHEVVTTWQVRSFLRAYARGAIK